MLVIALGAALMGGATYAWFSDGTATDQFTFSTGSVEIQVQDPILFPLNVDGIAPGYISDLETVTLENTGSLDLYYRMYFTGTGDLAEVLMVNIDGAEYLLEALLYDDTDPSTDANRDKLFESGTHMLTALTGTADHTVQISLPSGTGNEYANASFTGELVVEAVQVIHNSTPWE